jgi:mono/diheme cytochrome c family protein
MAVGVSPVRAYAEDMSIKIVKSVALIAVLIQFIPFGRNHLNPPATGKPSWNSPATRALFRRACFDCHSDEIGRSCDILHLLTT